MTQSTYRQTLAAARKDLDRLYRQREELERKIARLRQTIVSLGALTKESRRREVTKKRVEPNLSLTEAVKWTLTASEVPLTPKQIQQALEDVGYDIGTANPLASVWSVLKRLSQQPGYRGGKNKLIQNYARKGDSWYLSSAFWWGEMKPPEPWIPMEQARKHHVRRMKAEAKKPEAKAKSE